MHAFCIADWWWDCIYVALRSCSEGSLDKSRNCARGGVTNLEKCSHLSYDAFDEGFWHDWRAELMWGRKKLTCQQRRGWPPQTPHPAWSPGWTHGWTCRSGGMIATAPPLTSAHICLLCKQRAGPDARQRRKGGWPEVIDLFLVIDEPTDLRAWNSDGNGGGSIFCLTQLIQLWEREEETKHQHCLSELHHINQPSRFPCRSGNLTGKLFHINSSLYDRCYCCIYMYIGLCHPFLISLIIRWVESNSTVTPFLTLSIVRWVDQV